MSLGQRICTIGGGSGMPIVNKALVMAGFDNLRSIVTTFDNGGDTGRIRTDERGMILANSDYWRSLISLWDDGHKKKVWEEMLKFRDGRSRNFGNLFFQFMAEKEGNLSDVDKLFSELTGAELKGEVVPVSLDPSDICFKTESGKVYKGEHYLDSQRMSSDKVTKVWLDPLVKANPEAIESIKRADTIILCPGSMYGSVLINLLPKGMKEVYSRSKAKKILMANIMSVASENDNFSQCEYVDVFKKYLGVEKPFDLVLLADLTKLDQDKLKKVEKYYAMEHSRRITKCEDVGNYQTKLVDLAIIEEKYMRLRHSEKKIASVLRKILR
jgi:uncharacterized cofD-like protein